MILYEYEGKKLLAAAGINVPRSQLLTNPQQPIIIPYPLVLKAQILSGKRADLGGVVIVNNPEELFEFLPKLFAQQINNEIPTKVLVEEKVVYKREYYLSFSFDSNTRGVILSFGQEGGTGVEKKKVNVFPLNILKPQFPSDLGIDPDILFKLWKLFLDEDLLLLEINPFVQDLQGLWVALDAKIKTDDCAAFRHPEWNFSPRGVPGHQPTKREIQAKQIDQGDYRGVAGSTYFDLDGDIAILASGGGVSLTALDALFNAGGKPANYTEYSGNPPKEKVKKLTEIVVSKPGLTGLWVIGTVAANFTDIYETLSGIIEGIRSVQRRGIKADFPIVIRRGGPRAPEAYAMLAQIKDLDLHLQGPETSITQSAKIIASLSAKYKRKILERGIRLCY